MMNLMREGPTPWNALRRHIDRALAEWWAYPEWPAWMLHRARVRWVSDGGMNIDGPYDDILGSYSSMKAWTMARYITFTGRVLERVIVSTAVMSELERKSIYDIASYWGFKVENAKLSASDVVWTDGSRGWFLEDGVPVALRCIRVGDAFAC